MKGYIFNIQKFCLHDGPGIRTTVFFKGCNLRCAWCANPESQQMEIQYTLNREKCAGCGRCVSACEKGARSVENGLSRLDIQACVGCGVCAEACPTEAIAREGRCVTVDEVLEEAMKDAPFYARSGGGVTFSGGEPLLQPEFAMTLARALHEKGVTVAIETAGAVDADVFRKALPLLDFVHIDLKHYDGEAHCRGTGLDNANVIRNIRAVKESGIDFIVRIPVIPGFNDSIGDARGFAKLLKEMDIHQAQLLPFHQMGERKYDLLDRAYAFSGVSQLHREDLKDYQQEFERCGVRAQI